MAQTLGMYQTMAEDVVASKDLDSLIDTRRELIAKKRQHYNDVSLRTGLYQLIGLINRAISELNLKTIDLRIAAARVDLILANSMVTTPPLEFRAQTVATRVAQLASYARKTVTQLEADRHLLPLLARRKAQIDCLKMDIDSMSRTTLIAAAIQERQTEERKLLEQHRQERAAEAQRKAKLQRQETLHQAEDLKRCLSQFDMAISCSALDQARHALSIIEQAEPEVQSTAFNGQEPAMMLGRLRHQVKSLRRDLYGHHGIRNLDAPLPSAVV